MKSYNFLPNNLFKGNLKAHYEVRQLSLLRRATTCYYKVRQPFYFKVRQVLQTAMNITKCDRTHLILGKGYLL